MNGTPSPEGAGSRKVIRTIFFWAFMMFLAVLLWKMSSSDSSSKASLITHSEFLESLAREEVRVVTIEIYLNSAQISGSRKDRSEFRVVIARELIPDLTKLLTEKKVAVQFREGSSGDSWTLFGNWVPILLFVGLWIFMIRQMQIKKRQGPPGGSDLK